MAQLTKTRWLVSLLLLGCGASVGAQSLPDPTRPAVPWGDTETGAESGAQVESYSGPILQSILISPERKLAIISGQTVVLNGRYGDQTLIKITETEVILSKGSGKAKQLQTLKLFPDLVKKSVSENPSDNPEKKRRQGAKR